MSTCARGHAHNTAEGARRCDEKYEQRRFADFLEQLFACARAAGFWQDASGRWHAPPTTRKEPLQ